MKSRYAFFVLALLLAAGCGGGASNVTPNTMDNPESRSIVQVPASTQSHLQSIALPDNATIAINRGDRVELRLPDAALSRIPLKPNDCTQISAGREGVRPEYSVCSTPNPGPDPCAGVCGLPPGQCMDCVNGGVPPPGGGGTGTRNITQGTIWQPGQFEVLCGSYSSVFSGTATAFGINSAGQTFAGTLTIPAGKETWGFWIPSAAAGANAISITITGKGGTAICGGSG